MTKKQLLSRIRSLLVAIDSIDNREIRSHLDKELTALVNYVVREVPANINKGY